MAMSEFKFNVSTGQVVEVKEVPVATPEAMEVQFQDEANRLQDQYNAANEIVSTREAEYSEAINLVEQRSQALEAAREAREETETEQKFLASRRASYAEAMALAQSQPAEPAGADEADGASEEVDLSDRIHTAPEATV